MDNINGYEEIANLFPEINLGKNFEGLDYYFYSNLFQRGVYLYGDIAGQVIKEFVGLKIEAFVDDFPASEKYEFEGEVFEIISTSELNENTKIIIASNCYDEIKKQLEIMGKREYFDFIHYSYLYPRPSDMAKELCRTQAVTDWKCLEGFRSIGLEEDGGCYFCITKGWSKIINGNAFLSSYAEIEKSVITKLFRYSLETGKYCFCNARICSGLRDKIGTFGNDSYEWEAIKSTTNSQEKTAKASFDSTCNLFCESCRKKVIIKENDKVEYLKNYFMNDIMPNVQNIFCAANGEVFFSKYYQEILEHKHDGGLIVLSNGNLVDKENIEKISLRMNGNIVYSISVDAAHKETYQKLRRGGDFDRLVGNLIELGKEVSNGKAKALILNFVISKKNYKEILDFVELGRRVGATGLHFTQIANMGTFTAEEFEDISKFNGSMNTEFKMIIDELLTVKDLKIFFMDAFDVRQYVYKKLKSEL